MSDKKRPESSYIHRPKRYFAHLADECSAEMAEELTRHLHPRLRKARPHKRGRKP